MKALNKTTALGLALASPAYAQTVPAPAPSTADASAQATTEQPAPVTEDEMLEDEGSEIVVTGVRRGSVIGDIPPENQLTQADVRATGATDINERAT